MRLSDVKIIFAATLACCIASGLWLVSRPTKPLSTGTLAAVPFIELSATASSTIGDVLPLAQSTLSGMPKAAACHRPRAAIAMIAYGWKARGYEDASTIKGSKRSMDLALRGILRHVTARCQLHFYFVTGAQDAALLRELLKGVRSARTSVTYQFVSLDEERLGQWMQAIGHTPTHRTGPAGNIKFFYPLLFPTESRIMMLDSDILVARDICELWDHFRYFAPQQLMSFSPQANPMSASKDNQFNAGVALLHLERMRRVGWLQLAKASIDHWHAAGMRPRCCAHGDQSVFHMIRFLRPETLVHYLPRWWNINKCHQYQHYERHYQRWQQTLSGRHVSMARPSTADPCEMSNSEKSGEVFVGLVHLGCCKMCRREHLRGRWLALLDDILAHPLSVSAGRYPVAEVPLTSLL